jgi:hypothetical protein
MTRLLPMLLVFALSSACKRGEFVATGDELRVTPSALMLPTARVGFSSRATITVSNQSRATLELTLAALAPFSVGEAVHLLPGGSDTVITVYFRPTEAGAFDQTLHLEAGTHVFEVALHAQAVIAEQCSAPAACHAALMDSETGACVQLPQSDGTACASPCLQNATCRGGACTGTAKSCDDQNACTVDACGPGGACLHEARACAAPADPCKAALCDPVSGCATVDAIDGTSCGANDCVTARVCMAGTCLSVPAPDGSQCAAPTLCRDQGVCAAGSCSQPAPHPLIPAWTAKTAGTATVVFPGLIDHSGNLYWYEKGAHTDLVSATRDGVERFRVNIADTPNAPGYFTRAATAALVGDDLLVVLFLNRVEARSTIDGALKWKWTAQSIGPVLGIPSSQPMWPMSVGVAGTSGRVVINVRTNGGGSAWDSWVTSVEASTGTILWSAKSDYITEILSDETGNLYVYRELFEHALYSLSPAGTQRWSSLVSAHPVAYFNGALLTGYEAELKNPATGVTTQKLAMKFAADALVTRDHLVLADWNSLCSHGLMSVPIANPAASVVWMPSNNGCLFDPLLTSRGTVLAAAGASFTGLAPTPTLFEVDLNGVEKTACVLPTAVTGHSALSRGRWFMSDGLHQVLAFDVPGADFATEGWGSVNGNLQRTSRPAGP